MNLPFKKKLKSLFQITPCVKITQKVSYFYLKNLNPNFPTLLKIRSRCLASRGQKAVFEISEMRLLGRFSTTVRKDFVTQRSEFLSLRFVRITFVPQAEEDDGWLHSLVLLSCIHLAHHKKN